jgi:hypothetical protein
MMAFSELDLYVFFMGYRFYALQQLFGMRHSKDGVYYYAEVHKSVWNSYIHTAFMPLTMLGFYVAIPAFFEFSRRGAYALRRLSTAFYFGIYVRISPAIAVLFLAYYAIPMYYAAKLTKLLKRAKHPVIRNEVVIGFFISTVALLIQEVLGHYIGGDDVSRIEAIPNAIIYAPYYSVAHAFYILN